MRKLPLPWLAEFPVLAPLVLFPIMPASSAQFAGGPAEFDVASIRQSSVQTADGEGSTRSQIQYTADGLVMRNIDLSEMIQWAYGIQQRQVQGRALAQTSRYDVQARAAAASDEKTLKAMLQDLLATRFAVRMHREQQRMPVYELELAKGGARLPPDETGAIPASYPKERFPRVVDGDFIFTHTSMAEFAQQLTELRSIDLPVVDRTGIQGVYTITLKGAAKALHDPNGPSLLTLIREQLGLKLVPAKDSIEVVVVDHAEKPSPN